jgi:hypothetical protein
MIRINKGSAPNAFATRAAAAGANLERQYKARRADYDAGRETLKADSGVYGATAVKDRLKASHSRKCAYCEEFLPPKVAHGHVEHFRPVAFSQRRSKGMKFHPGYYWLAYDWDNFLLSCHFCNSVKKKNLFPLIIPGARVRVRGSVAGERPVFVKPDAEDPLIHIDWRKDVPFGRTRRGIVTVALLGLAEPAHEERLKRYREAEELRGNVVDCHASIDPKVVALVARARAKLHSWTQPDQPFSAMIAAFLRDYPLP